MNTKNNKRRKQSQEKITKVFIELLQEYKLEDIKVTDVVKASGLNRSTFYANFLDIYDLADKLREKLERDFSANFENVSEREKNGALKMFKHIKENQLFYKTYFKGIQPTT